MTTTALLTSFPRFILFWIQLNWNYDISDCLGNMVLNHFWFWVLLAVWLCLVLVMSSELMMMRVFDVALHIQQCIHAIPISPKLDLPPKFFTVMILGVDWPHCFNFSSDSDEDSSVLFLSLNCWFGFFPSNGFSCYSCVINTRGSFTGPLSSMGVEDWAILFSSLAHNGVHLFFLFYLFI